MQRILQLVPRPVQQHESTGLLEIRDVYDLPELELSRYAGMSISGACDQRFLHQHRELLNGWVRAGGKLVFSGHPMLPIIESMPKHRKLEFHSTRDLWLSAVDSHPIWVQVDRKDLLFNTGVPGTHSFEELTEIGVAGFYAHAYLVDLPEGAAVITGIGQGQLPVDLSYPLGDGEVIVHLGNDLLSYNRPGTSAAQIGTRALAYLAGTTADMEVAS